MAKDIAHTAQRAASPVNRSQVAQNTTQKAHRACTPVDEREVAKNTAHATQHTERTQR